MIFRSFFIIFIFITNLFSLAITSDDKYKVIEGKNYSIIFTPTNKKEAIYIKQNLNSYLKILDESFGYSFDKPIIISLVSPKVQIANAFSTQIPFNEAVFYGGGVQDIDYFSANSWLDTLLYHEITHNYQLNSKNNEVSQYLHKFLGNNYIPLLVPIPLFTLPNLFLPTAFLEGNAVLNESIHNNGGRLYNGRFKALSNLLILHNKMDKTRFINNHIDFPYTEEKYVVGSYFMLYLAKKYGLDKVNSFYQEQSTHFVNPFIINKTFQKHFHDSFNNLFYYFMEDTKKNAKDFKAKEDNSFIVSSKKEIYLSKDKDDILFLSNDTITQPILNIYNINSNKLKSKKGNWLNGKIFKVANKYYSSSATYISSTLYKSGLFDKDRFILDDTQEKAIQDIFEGHQLYFDVTKSFDIPSLYIDGRFYDKANSSALFDKKGNIYYFKQEKKQRALYKSKVKLFSFKGFSSKVVDILNDNIYFIGNSKDGSSLYKYDGEIKRVSSYDNIIDAKIIDEKKALVVTINHNNYRVYKIDLKDTKANIFTTNLKLKTKPSFGKKDIKSQELKSKDYNELKELNFSFLYPSFSYDSEDGALYILNAYFYDPLMFNSLALYAYKYDDERYTGFTYTNERYIPFEINLYDSKKDEPSLLDRDWGGYISIYGPLYKAGNHDLEIELKKYFDDENKHKAPNLLTNTYTYNLDFGGSFNPYFNLETSLYLKEDRDDFTYGANLKLSKHIYDEVYLNGSIKYINSDTNSLKEQRGIQIYEDSVDGIDDSDIYSASIDSDFYVKDITKSSIGISKTININKYFFTFPLSLKRESIYLKYNNYSYTQDKKDSFNEKILGVSFDTLFIHKLDVPIDIKYIKNSASKDDYKIVFSLGVDF